MDTLHLSYNEVLRVIPYRNLIIMQRDIMHETTNDVLKEVSEEEFFNGKVKFSE